jgi:nucleotide-binding universal stress UspA family protein
MSVIVAVDGSDVSFEAAAKGLELLAHPDDAVLVTVISASDPMLVTGTGTAGGTMSAEEFEQHESARTTEADALLADAARTLGLTSAQTRLVEGDPARALCEVADELSARAIVIGSRGRGGVARALLGSVSDYVVRNAPCPVVITS